MHKVVLEAKDESDLLDVDSKLKEGNIDHVVWREQPENIITAIATKPYAKSAFGTILRHLRLLKWIVCKETEKKDFSQSPWYITLSTNENDPSPPPKSKRADGFTLAFLGSYPKEMMLATW